MAVNQCNDKNIPISKNIEKIKINTRAKTRFGGCKKYVKKGREHFLIEIGSALSICDDKKILEIIIHELLHTAPNCHNHGMQWKKYAGIMNNVYGYNIKRTATYDEIGIDKNIEYRYAIQCEKCGNKIYRQKKSKLVKEYYNYKCSCGGKLYLIER